MAITVTQSTIGKVLPAFNPILVSFKSTEQTRSDFRYRLEIRRGNDAVLLGTKKMIGGTSVDTITTLDVSSFARTVVNLKTWRLNPVGGEYIYLDSTFKNYVNVRIIETYGGIDHAVVNVDGFFCFPAALSTINAPYFDYSVVSSQGMWLTNFKSISLRPSDRITVSFATPTTSLAGFQFEAFNSAGQSINVSSYLRSGIPLKDFVHIHAGLNDIITALSLSPSLLNTVETYTLSPIGYAARKLTFRIVRDCRFPGARVHYLNEWGGVDSFLFHLATRRSLTIERKKAKINGNGSNLRPSVFGLGNSTYNVRFTDELKLSSDFISEDDSNALLEMFTSPIISVECEQNIFNPFANAGTKIILPAEIDLNTYEIKQKRFEKLFNLDLDLKISVDNTRQTL